MGFGSNSGGTSTPSGYGFEVRNEITRSDFTVSDHDPRPIPIHLSVEEVAANETNEQYYEKTVSVKPNSTKRLRSAFSMPSGDSLYAVRGNFERILSEDEEPWVGVDRSDGFTFKPGEFGTPTTRFVSVRLSYRDDGERLFPKFVVSPYNRDDR